MMSSLVFKFCCLLLVLQLSSTKYIKPRRLNILANAKTQIRDDRCRHYQTFTQKVDHFGFSNMDTYEQRYIINTDNWESGKPIFFYAGNEGLIKTFSYGILTYYLICRGHRCFL